MSRVCKSYGRTPVVLALSVHIVCVAATIAGCQATKVKPIGGASFAPDSDEKLLWDRSRSIDSAVQARGQVAYRADLDAYLSSVVDRLRPPLGLGDAPLRVYVLKDPFLNAFAMPNGTVYVHSGLLARVENEAQLATVLGHELTHYAKRHSLVAMRSAQNKATTAQVVIGILSVLAAAATQDPNAARIFSNLGQSAAEPILHAQISGYSRDLEREADRDGFQALTNAGYDAREAVVVFEHLQEDSRLEGVAEPYFFGSHPSLGERSANYQQALVGWQPALQPPRVEAERYRQAIGELALDNVELDLAIGRHQRARATAERYLQFQPQSARGHYLLAEAYRRAGRSTENRDAAIAEYQRTVEIDPAYVASFRELGLLQRDAGQAQAAAAALRRYVELAPNAPDRAIIEAYSNEMRKGVSR